MQSPTQTAASLKGQAISGVKWNGLLMVVVTVLQFVTLAILARILSPADFGLMGMVMVIIGFAQVFSGMGLSNAIIHRQDVKKSHLSSFFWLNILLGIVIFSSIIMLSPLVGMYFRQPDLSRYLILASGIFLITSVGQTFHTLLRKELRFKTLAQVEIAGAAVYSLTAIGLAQANFGVSSLIFGQLVRSFITVVLLFSIFLKVWLPQLHFNLREIQSYLSFGAFQTGERIVNHLSARIDYIIVGRLLGPAALGFYSLAYQVMIFPLAKINPIITKVAFPAFSKIQNDHARLQKGYSRVINFISLSTFPLLLGVFVLAPEFIEVVFGTKWLPSITVLRIFCIFGIYKSLGNPIGSVLLAKGRADIGFYWNIFTMVMRVIAVLVGIRWGINGVALSLFILQVPMFFLIQMIVNRIIDYDFRRYFNAIKLPAICSIFMSAVLILLKITLGSIEVLPFLLLSISTGIVIYSASCYLRNKEFFAELKSVLVRS